MHAQHIQHIHMAGDHNNNNKMGRLNGEIRDREKTMRNVKTMDTPVLKGLQLYHNYFREHEGLNGKTPAEIAGIKIQGGEVKNLFVDIAKSEQLPQTIIKDPNAATMKQYYDHLEGKKNI